MISFAQLRAWWVAITHSARVHDDVETELQFHIDSYTHDLAVVLNDARHSQSLYLGSHLVESSESPGFSLNRPPVEESLRFALPAKSTMQRFDEITVVFMPSAERALAGVKIAILEFRLLPRESY